MRCARCNSPIRTAAATLAGLAFGPVCAKRLDLLPQRSAVIGRMVEDGVLLLQQRALFDLLEARSEAREDY